MLPVLKKNNSVKAIEWHQLWKRSTAVRLDPGEKILQKKNTCRFDSILVRRYFKKKTHTQLPHNDRNRMQSKEKPVRNVKKRKFLFFFSFFFTVLLLSPAARLATTKPLRRWRFNGRPIVNRTAKKKKKNPTNKTKKKQTQKEKERTTCLGPRSGRSKIRATRSH